LSKGRKQTEISFLIDSLIYVTIRKTLKAY